MESEHSPTPEERAEKLVDELMTNGHEDKGDRLVIMSGYGVSKHECDLGGWGRPALLKRVSAAIREAQEQERAENAMIAQLRGDRERPAMLGPGGCCCGGPWPHPDWVLLQAEGAVGAAVGIAAEIRSRGTKGGE